MTKTLSMLNKKGGVGKTSSCFHLAGAFADLGRQVLLIDNDPQGSLSRGFFGTDAVASLPRSSTLAALYDDGADPRSLVADTGVENIHIVPTNERHYGRFNVNPPEHSPYDFRALLEFIDEVGGYDYVLIDSPPNLYFCSWTAMLAADYGIVPTQTEDFGVQGLVDVMDIINQSKYDNPSLRVLGYLIGRYNKRNSTHRQYETQLREAFGDQVFGEMIPDSNTLHSALASRLPVTHHRPKSPAADSFRRAAEEIETRIGSPEAIKDERVAHG